MHDMTSAAAPHSGRFLPIARLGLLALALTLAACKGGPEGGKGKDGKDEANKGPEAVPVEVAKAGRRSIAASYAGTAPLEARGEAQVVAKTSGIALRVFADVGQQVHAGQPLVQIDRDRAALKLGYVDGEWVEVREGLREGDPVVVAGKSALREGSAVQVIGAKNAASASATAQAAAQ